MIKEKAQDIMASSLKWRRLLGFKDFFPNETPRPKEFYAQKVGKDLIEKTTPFFLNYVGHKEEPNVVDLLQEWFTFYNFNYTQSPYYYSIEFEYRRIRNQHPEEEHSVISVEGLLNLLLWVRNLNLPLQVTTNDASITLPLLELILLFNDDILSNYQKAAESVRHYQDLKQIQRITLAGTFSHSDLTNIDYAQLLNTQLYKAARLLKFLQANKRYKSILDQLLKDFGCSTKEEYLKAVGSAVITPLKGRSPAWSVLSLKHTPNREKAEKVLENLALKESEVTSVEQNDYLILRNKPFQKIGDYEYRVIFELFLIKKMYNGLIFKLSSLDKNFLADIRKDFSEAVLVYETLTSILQNPSSILISGDAFANLETEPDFYYRSENNIVLFESKDFFMPGKCKLSYDFNIIEKELMKEGRLKKAVIQLTKNIERCILKEIPNDNNYNVDELLVYPIIIVHDSLYSAPALNYWVYYWFVDELMNIKSNKNIQHFDFAQIAPITLIEIDTLLFYQMHLKEHFHIIDLVVAYHRHTRFDLGGQLTGRDLKEHALRSALSFSQFVSDFFYGQAIKLDLGYIEAIFEEYGIE